MTCASAQSMQTVWRRNAGRTTGNLPLTIASFPRCTAPRPDADLAVPLEHAHVRDGGCPNPPRRAGSSTCCSAATASETCSLIISQYSSGDQRQRARRRRPTRRRRAGPRPRTAHRPCPGATHRNMFGRSGSGAGSTASVGDRLHRDRRPRVLVRLDPHRRAEPSPGFSTPGELGRRLRHVGEEHVPETHGHAVEGRVVERQIVGAAHLRLDVGDVLRSCSPRGHVQHLRDEIGQHRPRPFGAGTAMVEPGSPVPEAMSRCW